MEKLKILYMTNDKLDAELTKKLLETNDFKIDVVTNEEEVLNAYHCQKPDILLLDLDTTRKDWLEIIILIRTKDPLIRILIYTLCEEFDKELAAINTGADVFISKKHPNILMAHLRNLRKKKIIPLNTPRSYQITSITAFNIVTRTITIQGEKLRLGSVEAKLLQLLCDRGNQLAHMDYLMQGVWKTSSIDKRKRLKEYMSRLRKPLKKDPFLKIKYCGNNHEEGYILTCS